MKDKGCAFMKTSEKKPTPRDYLLNLRTFWYFVISVHSPQMFFKFVLIFLCKNNHNFKVWYVYFAG